MTGYSVIYLILSAILIIYSIRHRLDLICVASVCYIVYTIYCIPGFGISGQYRPKLSHSLYYSVFMQLVIIIIIVVALRYSIKRRDSQLQFQRLNNSQLESNSKLLKISFRIYTLIILGFAMMNIASVGLGAFASGKIAVWEQTNILYIISLYGAWPSFAYGIHNNDKLVWIPSLLVELTIFFAGSRAFTATIIVVFLCEKGTELWMNRKNYTKIYILGAMGVVFLLLYRMVDTQIMAGDLAGAINTLKNPLTWMTAFEFNEPRVIIANYDYAFTSGMRFPIGDVIYRIIDFVPGLTAIFGIELQYPEYYSTWLMNQVHGSAGVGGSIWGESYAMMGYFGIIVMTILWLSFIIKCNKHLNYHKEHSYFVVALGTYLAWYINRLDFNRVAQSVKVMVFCFCIWAIIYLVLGGSVNIGRMRIVLR